MKALRSFGQQQFFGKNASHDLIHILARQPRQHFISSSRRIISFPSSQASTFTATRSSQPSLNYNTLRNLLFRRTPRPQQRRPNSTKSSSTQAPPSSANPSPNPTPNLNSPGNSENLSLSARLRKLSREYGWSALGVYLLLSALDFPFCFAAVRLLGVERIGRWEHYIVNGAKDIISYPFPEGTFNFAKSEATGDAKAVAVGTPAAEGSAEVAQSGTETEQEWKGAWGYEEAEEAYNQGATIWTQLALAYAIHKSFIFLRVPLTAAVTPKVVKTLRGWGWNIGKRKPKPQQ